jgi:coproporphyrinogen III oxidase-like Fe-S oxidoreductase
MRETSDDHYGLLFTNSRTYALLFSVVNLTGIAFLQNKQEKKMFRLLLSLNIRRRRTRLFLSADYSNEANVYIHWPYCRRKCNYCNFNKYIESEADRDQMVSCLKKEWATLKSRENITKVQTVFFGGGTPSLMKPKDVEKILRSAKSWIIF